MCIILFPPDDLWPEKERPKNGSEPEWVLTARKQFHETKDVNKDGKLDDAEVKAWVLPDINEQTVLESEHLIKESDADKVRVSIIHFCSFKGGISV